MNTSQSVLRSGVFLSLATLLFAVRLEAQGAMQPPAGSADSWNGEPDARSSGGLGTVLSHQKISATHGDFGGTLGASFQFGKAIVSLGDLDGDGIGDLAVGVDDRQDGDNLGSVWILFLRSDGTVKSEQRIGHNEGGFGALGRDHFFGSSIASLGDLDGNGTIDLAVSAHGDNDFQGAIWILFLEPDGTVSSFQKLVADIPDDFFGSGVAAGDIDGDGRLELMTGSPSNDDGGLSRGAVYIVFLNDDLSVSSVQRISDTEGGFTGLLTNFSRFGRAVAFLGDLDGDGVGDLAVTSSPRAGQDGVLWILSLHPDGTVKSHRKITEGESGFEGEIDAFDGFGSAVALFPDLDADGVNEIVVGARLDQYESDRPGAAWILFMNADGTVEHEQKIGPGVGGFEGRLGHHDNFGHSVAPVGDVNGDGVTDLGVGATFDDDGFALAGAVWLLNLKGKSVVEVGFETAEDAQAPLVNGESLTAGQLDRFFALSTGGAGHYGAAVFDSTPGGPNELGPDRDLLVGLGNVLILQENPRQSVEGIFDVPDDAAVGGSIRFDFPGFVELRSIDLVDICPGLPPQDVMLALLDREGDSRFYHAPGGWTGDVSVHGAPGFGTLDLTTLEPQPGFQVDAVAFETPDFQPDLVVRLEVFLSSSGALDNLEYVRQP